MTYNVFGGMLTLTQSINQSINRYQLALMYKPDPDIPKTRGVESELVPWSPGFGPELGLSFEGDSDSRPCQFRVDLCVIFVAV